MSQPVSIDGRRGEGGGQILRTALCLATSTGMPFVMDHIRAGRRKPGLAAQHLTAVRVMADLCRAAVEGASLGSQALTFRPTTTTRARELRADVAEQSTGGSAGSVTLVLQSLLPASPTGLTFALAGGTHVPWSPPYHYVERVHLPLLARMGLDVALEIRRWGFYPQGRGLVAGEVRQAGRYPLILAVPGRLERIVGLSVAANLSADIARRQADAANRELSRHGVEAQIETRRVDAACPGTAIMLVALCEHSRGGAGALGRRGLPAEKVGRRAARHLIAYLESGAALDEHQGDQLVVPAALGAGESTFTVARVTPHLLTNANVIRAFLGDVVTVKRGPGERGTVWVRGIGQEDVAPRRTGNGR